MASDVLDSIFRSAREATGIVVRIESETLAHACCHRAASERFPVYCCADTREAIARVSNRLPKSFPGLRVAGMSVGVPPSSHDALDETAAQIRAAGCRLVLVGFADHAARVAIATELQHRVSLPMLCVDFNQLV